MPRELEIPGKTANEKPVDTCSTCKFWLFHTQIDVLLNESGQMVPPAMLETLPIKLRVSLIKTTQSFCARFPKWELTMHNHWCWEFLARSIKREEQPMNFRPKVVRD
jgi:hypothetical protein